MLYLLFTRVFAATRKKYLHVRETFIYIYKTETALVEC